MYSGACFHALGTPRLHAPLGDAAWTTARSRQFLFKSLGRLLADAQLADNFAVAVSIMRLQVVQQATAFANEH